MRITRVVAAIATAIVAALGGCGERAASREPVALGAYLDGLAGASEATRTREVASWRLDRAAWTRTVVEPYTQLHDDYARRFDASQPALVAALARPARVTTRAHYAGDLRLTLGQARARWALPVQYPSEVVELDGEPLDVVFVRDGDRWRAITGLDEILRARIAARDPACAAHVATTRSGPCADVGWVVADALLRTHDRRFARACALAANLCVVNGPP